MAQARLNELNAKIHKIDPRFELVRGDGYHYMTFSHVEEGNNHWEDESIMVPYTGSMTSEQWMEIAIAFINKHKDKG